MSRRAEDNPAYRAVEKELKPLRDAIENGSGRWKLPQEKASTAVTLPDLIECLQKAEGPSRELDGPIYSALIGVDAPDAKRWYGAGVSVTESIDAAIAFKDRVLPGCKPSIGQNVHHGYWHVVLRQVVNDDVLENSATHETSPAIAIIIATLRALNTSQQRVNETEKNEHEVGR